MIKPKMLQKGDRVAVVSLSSGILGEREYIHKYHIAKARLEGEFGLEVVAMPNALKGVAYLYNHPQKRAEDLHAAFLDPTVKAVISAIGGDDTIRLLPFIDFNVLRENPKIFTGFSDTTANHLMLHKAGIVSFYGPCIMSDFGEYVKMNDYTKEAVQNLLFHPTPTHEIKPSPYWSGDFTPWREENKAIANTYITDPKGYEVLQGHGVVVGEMLGGCLDALVMYMGSEIWPTSKGWAGKILVLETSEDKPTPDHVTWVLRGLCAQGILQVVAGIIVGKPQGEVYYDEYKKAFKKVLQEAGRDELPVFYNVNIGHAMPNGILPFGVKTKLDCRQKTITLMEPAVL